MVAVRHSWRGQQMEPLLELIASATACRDPKRGVCELGLGQAAAKFDLHEHEGPLLGFLYRQAVRGEPEEMREVLAGAYIKLQDGDGFIYDYLRNLPGAHRRSSSHRSDRPSYGVPEGKVLKAVLLGTRDNSTWLQLEASPWDPLHRFWGSLGHVLDFIEYASLRQNVGPLGTSMATDRRPLLAGPPAPTSEACPTDCTAELATPAPAALASAPQPAALLQLRLRGAAPPAWEGELAEPLARLGGGVGGAAAAAGIRIGSRFVRRLALD